LQCYEGVQLIVVRLGDCSKMIYIYICICVSVHHTTADYIPVDLSKESNIDPYVRELRKLYPHGVDILVNNAGNSVINTAY